MSDYRSDMLIRLLQTMDRRIDRDEGFYDENTIQDVFYPLSERVSREDSVTVESFDPSLARWGVGNTADAILFEPTASDWQANGLFDLTL